MALNGLQILEPTAAELRDYGDYVAYMMEMERMRDNARYFADQSIINKNSDVSDPLIESFIEKNPHITVENLILKAQEAYNSSETLKSLIARTKGDMQGAKNAVEESNKYYNMAKELSPDESKPVIQGYIDEQNNYYNSNLPKLQQSLAENIPYAIRLQNLNTKNFYNYTPNDQPGAIDYGKKYELSSIIDRIIANNYQPITITERQLVSSDGNSAWDIIGNYYLDNDGNLQRNATTTYEDRGLKSGGLGGLLGGALSFFTGGATDAVQGKAPLTGALEALGVPDVILNANNFASDVINPTSRGWNIGVDALQNNISGSQAIDQLLDVPKFDAYSSGTNQGAVDYGTRVIGDAINANAPGLQSVIGTVLPLVTTAIGTAYGGPIGAAGGAAVGTGLTSKLGEGTSNPDYGGDFVKSGVAGGTAYVTASAANALNGLMSTPVNPDQAYIDQVANSGVFNNINNGTVPVDGIYESQLSNQGLSGLLGDATPSFTVDPTLAVPVLNPTDYVIGGQSSNLTPEDIYTNQAVNDLQGAVKDTALGTNTVYTPADAYASGDLGLSAYSGTDLPQFSVNTSYKSGLLDNILKHKTDIAKLATKGLNAYLDSSTPQFTMPSVGKAAEFKFNTPKLNTWSDYSQKLAGQTQSPLVGSNRIMPFGMEDAQKTKYLRNALDYKNDLQTRLADQKNLKYWSDYLGG